jgi:hypothetical protein
MKRRRKESGYALLLVFLLAACVAIMLYREVPRVAFEAERQRELLLIDRGNQFKRAIQVFYTDKVNNPTRRYPATIDELESLNNHRYLRRRYVDPMTGKDEWRLVHINGGILTDSVTTQQPNSTGGANGAQSTSATPAPPAYISGDAYMDASANPNGGMAGGAARAMNRRPSDSAQPGAPGSDTSQQAPGGSPGMPGGAGGVGSSNMPPANGLPVAVIPGQPGGAPGGFNPGGMPGGGVPGIPGASGAPSATAAPAPCTVYIGTCPTTTPTTGQTGQIGQSIQPGFGTLPGQPGNAVNSQGGGVSPAYPTAPGSNANTPGFGQPGSQMNPQAQSAAAAMINGLLTTPRPGGMPTTMPGMTMGGGIAGVASKYQAEGIMVINNRTAINEWEYIFDASKYRAPPNPVSGPAAVPVGPSNPASSPTGASPNTNAPTGSGASGH